MYKIQEVKNNNEIKKFHYVNYLINKDLPKYIQPLTNMVESEFIEFNKSCNNINKNECIRWILFNDDKLIGRIAAFVNSSYKTDGTDYPLGCIGFFECIKNQEAANVLFNTAINWLKCRNVEAVDGPINFNNRNNWWGVLVDGFDKYPLFGVNFNPDYYQLLFENYGFKAFYNQYYYGNNSSTFPDLYRERYEKFISKPDYTTQYLNFKNIDKFVKDYVYIYNAAWAQHHENKYVTEQQVLQIFKNLKNFLDPDLCVFAYYKNEPIGMYLNLPNLNAYIKKFKGKLNTINKLRFLYNKKFNKDTKVVGLIFGVIPKYQLLGVDNFMIYDLKLNLEKKIKTDFNYEIGWTGDWNPRMLNIYKKVGAKQIRRLITYRYIFDEKKHAFSIHPIMKYER